MFQRLNKYHSQFNTIDAVKCIAVIAMIIDHVGVYLLHNNPDWRIIGRIAAPLFFFLVGYSSNHYKPIQVTPWQNWFKSPLNLILFGMILTVTDYCIYHDFLFNILINIFLIKEYLHRYPPSARSDNETMLLAIFLLLFNGFVADWLEYGLMGLTYAIAAERLLHGRRLFAAIIFIATLLLQFSAYTKYIRLNPILLMTVGIFIFAVFITFQFKEIKLPKSLKNPLLFLSRYCFEIYFWHLFLLQLYTIFR